jgi:hypothetical protein
METRSELRRRRTVRGWASSRTVRSAIRAVIGPQIGPLLSRDALDAMGPARRVPRCYIRGLPQRLGPVTGPIFMAPRGRERCGEPALKGVACGCSTREFCGREEWWSDSPIPPSPCFRRGLRAAVGARASPLVRGHRAPRAVREQELQGVPPEDPGGQAHLRLPGCTKVADTMDHIVAVSLGGGNEPSNLRPMCRKHNQDLGRDLGNQMKRRRQP